MPRLYRKERLDELLRRELETIISYEMEDPRLENVTVTDVDVARDLQMVRVYVAVLDQNRREQDVLEGLERAKGYIRNQIAGRVQLRRLPDLVFRIDRTLAQAQRVDAILDVLEYSQARDEGDAKGA